MLKIIAAAGCIFAVAIALLVFEAPRCAADAEPGPTMGHSFRIAGC
jgi:hypothetical protein